MIIWRSLTVALAAFWVMLASAPDAIAQSYSLGPEDVVRINVVEWEDATGTYVATDWISGDYTVSVDGTISLPVVGGISVAGMSTAELDDLVAQGLMSSAGLLQLPIVTSQIAAYRPLYISGDVNNPGAFEWRPQLTASKAIALAGGVIRTRVDALDDAAGFREISNLRSVQVEIVRFLAREARLQAELDELETINFPEDLFHPDGPEALERIKIEEQALLEIRRESTRRATESNEELIALHRTELASFEGKLGGLQSQLELTRQQVVDLEALVERGSVTANRLITVQRTLTELNAEELDLNTGIFRARQRISETQRDLLQLTDNRRNEVMTRLQDTRQRIELATKREEMLAGLATMSGVQPVDASFIMNLQVRRTIGEGVEIISIGPDDQLLPGDVFEIEMALEMAGR